MWAEEEEEKPKQMIRREAESSQDVCTPDSDHFPALYVPLASSLQPSCVSPPQWHSLHFPSLAGPSQLWNCLYSTWRIWLWPTVCNTGIKPGAVEFYSSLAKARGAMPQQRAAAQSCAASLLRAVWAHLLCSISVQSQRSHLKPQRAFEPGLKGSCWSSVGSSLL